MIHPPGTGPKAPALPNLTNTGGVAPAAKPPAKLDRYSPPVATFGAVNIASPTNFWATPPKLTGRNSAPFDLVAHRGSLITEFEREFGQLTRCFFANPASLWEDIKLQHPEIQEVPDFNDDFTSGSQQVLGHLLKRDFEGWIHRLIKAKAQNRPAQNFYQKWKRFLPLFKAIHDIETTTPDHATRLLANMTTTDRKAFDRLRTAIPFKTLQEILGEAQLTSQHYSRLLHQLTEVHAKTRQRRSGVFGFTPELFARIDALSPDEHGELRNWLLEKDRLLWDVLTTEIRWGSPKEVSEKSKSSKVQDALARIQSLLADFERNPDELRARMRGDLGLTEAEWRKFSQSLPAAENQIVREHFLNPNPQKPVWKLTSYGSSRSKHILAINVLIKLMSYLRDPEAYFLRFGKGQSLDLSLTTEQKTQFLREHDYYDHYQREIFDYAMIHGTISNVAKAVAQATRSSRELIQDKVIPIQLAILILKNDFDFTTAWNLARQRRRRAPATS